MASALVLSKQQPLSKVISNHMEAALVVGATSYLVGCTLIFHKDGEFNKQQLVAEVISAGYAVWKWKMGLGPEPSVKTGLENEVPRCKAFEEG